MGLDQALVQDMSGQVPDPARATSALTQGGRSGLPA